MKLKLRAAATTWTFVLSIAMGLTDAAAAHEMKTLYRFCQQANCTDGSTPDAGLLMDSSGNLFGTTMYGGAHNKGTIFELAKAAKGWRYKLLYSFCQQGGFCLDGANPRAALIEDTQGNLYGTVTAGGARNVGAVFELVARKRLKVLYSSCRRRSCPDGNEPESALTYQGAEIGLPYDGVSPLYGSESGAVFKLQKGSRRWTETTVYRFCSQPACTDGAGPGAISIDQAGNLFGSTTRGGKFDSGTIFQISPDGTETVLHSFCEQANCTDGLYPTGGVILDADGNLYGMTYSGGLENFGLVFGFSRESGYSVLHSLCNECGDGVDPYAGLTMDAGGNLFGMTTANGAYSGGTIFQMSDGAFQVIYNFCAQPDCTDGAAPAGTLIMDSAGDLFGIAAGGGMSNGGAVFELTP
jgi:uncharacterized repeat protein (TIGR03803 family)